MKQVIPALLEREAQKYIKTYLTNYHLICKTNHIPIAPLPMDLLSDEGLKRISDMAIRFYLFIYETKMTDHYKNGIPFGFWTNIHNHSMRTRFRVACADFTPTMKFEYGFFLTLLEKLGYIEINHHYSVGEYSKSYRLNSNKLEDFILHNTPGSFRSQADWIREYPQHSEVIKTHYRTKIDFDAVKETIKGLKDCGYKNKPIDHFWIFRVVRMCQNINTGNLWFGESESGRFFSTITSLPSVVRKFLLIDGKKTKTLDLRNAQPLMLSKIIGSQEMYEDCKNGVFYDKLKDGLVNISREGVKKEIFRNIMFNNNKSVIKNDFTNHFDKIYPNSIKKIDELKNKTRIWFLLQKMESDIFVQKTKSLNIPYLTCHDSISVIEEDLPVAKNTLGEILKEKDLEGILEVC